jgi:sugar lactone lactonase YvrE
VEQVDRGERRDGRSRTYCCDELERRGLLGARIEVILHSCALGGPDGRMLFMVAADWSKGPAMVTGELTDRVLALDVSVPCP